jgi:hypothetical protein
LFHPEAAAVVDAFIERSVDVRPALLDYARHARIGHVL